MSDDHAQVFDSGKLRFLGRGAVSDLYRHVLDNTISLELPPRIDNGLVDINIGYSDILKSFHRYNEVEENGEHYVIYFDKNETSDIDAMRIMHMNQKSVITENLNKIVFPIDYIVTLRDILDAESKKYRDDVANYSENMQGLLPDIRVDVAFKDNYFHPLYESSFSILPYVESNVFKEVISTGYYNVPYKVLPYKGIRNER